MKGCLTIPLDFFPPTSSSVRVGFYAVMKLPILGNDLSVEVKEAGLAASIAAAAAAAAAASAAAAA
jgi:hypothetical protein